MQHDSQQVQTFGDIAMGDGSVFTINQIIQVTASEIQTRPLNINSPYRGLKRFEVNDKDLFFGRDQLIAKLIDNLKNQNHLLVLGASGSGKSSVMRAGVIPQLVAQLSNTLQTFTFAPDRNPFRSLWGCLVSGGVKQSDADCVLDNPDDALLTLIKHHKPASAQWLFFIDQFEEIFTLCQDLDQRQSFIRNLLQASSVGQGAIKIVLAMRADFLDRFGGYPELGQIAQQNIYLITDMHPDELRLAIEQPAAKHGVVFEAGLVDEIIRDLEGQAGALPLLQYTLDLLWQRSDLGDSARADLSVRTLRCKTYRELGGVRGALQQRVEDLYGGLDECDRTTTKQIFLRLIDITGAAEEMDVVGKAVSRRAALSEFDHEAAQKVLPQLIDANLLVSNRQDTSTVELAHETLINAWPKLKQWIDDSKEVIVMQTRLSDDAQHWQQMQTEDPDHAQDELWRGAKLQRALELREEGLFELWVGGLNQEEVAFLEASVESRDRAARAAEHRRKQQLKLYQRFAIVASFLCACIAGLSFWLRASWVKAEQQKILETAKSSGYAFGSFESNRYTLNALLEGLEAGRAIQRGTWAKRNRILNTDVLSALSSAMYWVRERNRLEQHQGAVRDVAFSPNGQLVATASSDRKVRLWTAEGDFTRLIGEHDEEINSIIFISETQLLTASNDATAKLWNINGEAPITFEGHKELIYSIAFDPVNETVVTASQDGTVKLWDLQGNLQHTINDVDSKFVHSVAFSSDGQFLATAGGDGVIKLWTAAGKFIREIKAHTEPIAQIAFSPAESNSPRLVSASLDNTLKLWDINTGQEIQTFTGHTDRVYSVAFSPDGQQIASSGYDNRVKLWSLSGDQLESFQGHQALVFKVKFSPDGQILASSSGDNTVKLWQLSNQNLKNLRGHTRSVQDIVFSPQGDQIATASDDATVKLWSSEGNWKRDLKHQGDVYRVRFSPDGGTLYSGDEDGTLAIWSTDGAPIKSFPAHPEGAILDIAISPDGQTIATAGYESVIRLWSAQGDLRQELPVSSSEYIWNLSFSPDGQILFAGDTEGHLQFWNPSSGKLEKTIDAHNSTIRSIQVSQEKQLIATASEDQTVKLWTLSGEPVGQLVGHQDAVWSAVFSPDASQVATASGDKTIRIWRLDGSPIAVLRGHQEIINAVSFSPDGQWLASASNDQTALLWHVAPLSLNGMVDLGCDWLLNYLDSHKMSLCSE